MCCFLAGSVYGIRYCVTMSGTLPLASHELIQITGQLMGSTPFHPLQLYLHFVPVQFYCLCACASGRIYETN